VSGTKADLVGRLVNGVEAWSAPTGDISYEYDSSNPKKVPYLIETAKTGKAKCIRCYRCIPQGAKRIGFETWDPRAMHAVTRWFHIECLCLYPPRGISSFDEIKWKEGGATAAEKSSVRQRWNNQLTNEDKQTGATLEGIRELKTRILEIGGLDHSAITKRYNISGSVAKQLADRVLAEFEEKQHISDRDLTQFVQANFDGEIGVLGDY